MTKHREGRGAFTTANLRDAFKKAGKAIEKKKSRKGVFCVDSSSEMILGGYGCSSRGIPFSSSMSAGDLRSVHDSSYSVTPSGFMTHPESPITPSKLPSETPSRSRSRPRGRKGMGDSAERVGGAIFRSLNAEMYQNSSDANVRKFEEEPDLFELYHRNFRQQVAKWKENPVDGIISWLRQIDRKLVIGDFGCGDAAIARALKKEKRFKIYSFDLHKGNKFVIACNISSVPLKNDSLDMAIFCLSLMGSDWLTFIREAYRCLKPGGKLYIVEVASRITSVPALAQLIVSLGFVSQSQIAEQFFAKLQFFKGEIPPVNITKSLLNHAAVQLKPCLFKPR